VRNVTHPIKKLIISTTYRWVFANHIVSYTFYLTLILQSRNTLILLIFSHRLPKNVQKSKTKGFSRAKPF